MRKRIFGRKLKRTIDQRKGLFRSLMRSMILTGRIKTTEAKAKAVRPDLEKLVTLAKKKGDGAYRDLLKKLTQEELVEKMIKTIAPKFETRPGGYTRILKIGNRIKDAAPMVYMEWTERVAELQVESGKMKDKENKIQKTVETKTSGKKEAAKKTQSTVKKIDMKEAKKK